MFANAPEPIAVGHAHDVDLEDTFDFRNTDDTDNGFPAEKLPTLGDALDWFVDRGVIHKEGADYVRGHVASQPSLAESELRRIHVVRGAMREIAAALVEHRAPDPAALETT